MNTPFLDLEQTEYTKEVDFIVSDDYVSNLESFLNLDQIDDDSYKNFSIQSTQMQSDLNFLDFTELSVGGEIQI